MGYEFFVLNSLDKDYNSLNDEYEKLQEKISVKDNQINDKIVENNYDNFIKQMKNRIENVYNNGGSIEEYIEDVYTEYGENVGNIVVKLNKTEELIVDYKKYPDESGKIADNVLFFRIINGASGSQYLYYVTESGKVYQTDALAYFPKKAIVEYDYKNVVDILPVSGIDNSKKHAIFVDIDESVYR